MRATTLALLNNHGRNSVRNGNDVMHRHVPLISNINVRYHKCSDLHLILIDIQKKTIARIF